MKLLVGTLFITLCSLSLVQGQTFWDILFLNFNEQCLLENPDPANWWVTQHCKNYNGTVTCMNRDPENNNLGTCACNMGPDAYFDDDDESVRSCVGKVDSICTSEYTGFLIPEKRCTPNAECISIQEGHTVGRCQCVYGYVEDENRMCIPREDIEDGDRSTPRTTTTTERSWLPPFKFPPIRKRGTFGESCAPVGLLNTTYCPTFGATVACIEDQCRCTLGEEDSVFDEEVNRCVSLVGSYCLATRTLWGEKSCTRGAGCFPITGTFEDGYSFGTCQCLAGNTENADGTCTIKDDGGNGGGGGVAIAGGILLITFMSTLVTAFM